MRKPGKRLESELTDTQKVELAKGNHIWLNAFKCISPTDEFLLGLGRDVFNHLRNSDVVDDLSESFPITYIRINWS
jgi:hypothetical protein